MFLAAVGLVALIDATRQQILWVSGRWGLRSNAAVMWGVPSVCRVAETKQRPYCMENTLSLSNKSPI